MRFVYISDCAEISQENIYVNVVIKTMNIGQLWGRGMTAAGVIPLAITATADFLFNDDFYITLFVSGFIHFSDWHNNARITIRIE